jgi:hypothetical protein
MPGAFVIMVVETAKLGGNYPSRNDRDEDRGVRGLVAEEELSGDERGEQPQNVAGHEKPTYQPAAAVPTLRVGDTYGWTSDTSVPRKLDETLTVGFGGSQLRVSGRSGPRTSPDRVNGTLVSRQRQHPLRGRRGLDADDSR